MDASPRAPATATLTYRFPALVLEVPSYSENADWATSAIEAGQQPYRRLTDGDQIVTRLSFEPGIAAVSWSVVPTMME